MSSTLIFVCRPAFTWHTGSRTNPQAMVFAVIVVKRVPTTRTGGLVSNDQLMFGKMGDGRSNCSLGFRDGRKRS